MKASSAIPGRSRRKAGFTLTEMLFAMFIMLMALAGSIALFLTYRHAWISTTLARNTSTEASFGLERIVYGIGTNGGLRAAEFATVAISYPAGGWQVSYNTNRFMRYSPGSANIVDENGALVCTNVIASTAGLTNNGCTFSLTVRESDGGHTVTNAMSSFVQCRN